jgi:hypothetical protein
MRERAPPDRRRPRRDNATRPSENGSAGQRAETKDSTKRFVVRYRKHSGVILEYGQYVDRTEADRVCGLLRWAGAVAHVEVAS